MKSTTASAPKAQPKSLGKHLHSAEEVRAEQSRRSLAHFIRYGWHVLEATTPLEWNWHIDAIAGHVQAALDGWIAVQMWRSAREAARKSGEPFSQPRPAQPFQNLLVNVPPGTAKPCYTGGMIVEKSRGLISLGEVNIGDCVLTHHGRFRRVLAVHEQGVLPLLHIQTQRGRIVKVAEEHPLLTARGWIEARHLVVGDVLAEVHPGEGCGSKTISHEEARLLGYLIGDGCLSQGQAATFTNQDPLCVADFISCAHSLGFATRVKKRPGKSAVTNIVALLDSAERKGRSRVACGPVRAWVRAHGLERKSSYTKRVPLQVLAGDDEIVCEFLAAYWACDGTISDRRDLPRAGREGQLLRSVRVAATTVSEGLGRDLQALLNRLGLSFTLSRKEARFVSARQGDTYVSWLLSAQSQDTVAKFMALLAPRMRHEKSARAPGTKRTGFDAILNPDPVVSIEAAEAGECRCLTVEEDASFSFEGVAVHNSRIVAVYAPAWMWTAWPEWKSLFLSSNPNVALRDSVYCRDVIESEWYQRWFRPDWTLSKDQNAKSFFRNSVGGYRQARGFMAKITGDRADALVWDDPHDADEDGRGADFENVLNRWDKAIANRVNDARSSLRIGIMQRLNERDLSGHVLAQGGWEHVSIPQEFEAARPCDCTSCQNGVTSIGWRDPRAEEGELMFPRRFPRGVLDKERARLGQSGYAGQHQQRPAPAGGDIFRVVWWRFWVPPGALARTPPHRSKLEGGQWYEHLQVELPARLEDYLQSWDMAFTASAGSAYVVGQVWARSGLDRFLLGQKRDKMDFVATLQAVRDLSSTWPQARVKLVENKANGPAVISSLRAEIDGIVAVEPDGGKEARAYAESPTIESGHVYLPHPAHFPWVRDLLDEVATFPNGAYADQVDTMTQALARIRKMLKLAEQRDGGGNASRTVRRVYS